MDVEQFVQGFPKINYWDSRHQLKSEGKIHYFCNEKLDGTCLAIFPLKDENGKVIELVAKTRGKAVADEHILEMYSLVDKKAILDYFDEYSKDETDVLFFELYGTLNRHEIAHMDTYIDIKLIGIYKDGKFLNGNEIQSLQSEIIDLRVLPLFSIIKDENESEFRIIWAKCESRFSPYKFEITDSFPTLYDAVQEVKGICREKEEFETVVDVSMDAFIPDSYISNEFQKLDIYKRIAGIETDEEYEEMVDELMDRFGEPPRTVLNLLAIANVKAAAHKAYITEIKQKGGEFQLTLFERARLDTAQIPALVQSYGNKIQLRLSGKNPYFLFYVDGSQEKMLKEMKEFVLKLAGLSEK